MTTDARLVRLSGPFDLARTLYPHMLLEDAGRAFPYRRFHEDFVVEVRNGEGSSPWSEATAGALDRGRFGSGGRRRHALEDAIRDFAEECIHHVLMFGEAAYELVFWGKRDEGGWQEFDLVLIHPYWRRFGRHYHYLAGNGSRPGRVIRLASDSVVVFRLEPASRRREVADAVAILARASGLSVAAMDLAMGRRPHDLGKHLKVERAILARATRPIGWTGRDLFHSDALEPYRAFRELRFALFQAELRDMIVTGINIALQRAGTVLGFEGDLSVRGVPTANDINNAADTLRAGPGTDRTIYEVLRSVQ